MVGLTPLQVMPETAFAVSVIKRLVPHHIQPLILPFLNAVPKVKKDGLGHKVLTRNTPAKLLAALVPESLATPMPILLFPDVRPFNTLHLL